MNVKNIGLSSVVVFGVATSLLFGASAAHAEVDDAVDAAIVDSSLTYLGLEEVSDELTASLTEGMDAATDAGIVPTPLIDAVIQDGDSTGDAAVPADESAPEVTPLDPGLEQLFDEQLDLDQERWDEAGPLWIAAFESIRADFDTCRAEGQNTSQCARTMAFSLQVAQAEALLTQLDERLLAIPELPTDQQEQAKAELEAERVALENRLVRAETRLATVSAPAAGAQPSRVVELLASVRDKAQATRGAGNVQVGEAPVEQQSGVAGSAQQSQPSQVPQPSQKPATPNTGGAQNSRPEAPVAPGSQGTRPQAPGANPGNSGNGGVNR